jgi:hypothetical protein
MSYFLDMNEHQNILLKKRVRAGVIRILSFCFQRKELASTIESLKCERDDKVKLIPNIW